MLVLLAVGSFAINELGNVFECEYEEHEGLIYKVVNVQLDPVEYLSYKNLVGIKYWQDFRKLFTYLLSKE